jgi:hypothetical protein
MSDECNDMSHVLCSVDVIVDMSHKHVTCAVCQVDATVVTSVPKLDMTYGLVSLQLLAAAGQGIQAELKQQYPNGAKFGDVVESSGGNLGCKSIYYVICDHYKPGNDAVCIVYFSFAMKNHAILYYRQQNK